VTHTSAVPLHKVIITDLKAEFESMALPMSMRLRDQAMRKIEEERWMFESSDRFHSTRLR